MKKFTHEIFCFSFFFLLILNETHTHTHSHTHTHTNIEREIEIGCETIRYVGVLVGYVVVPKLLSFVQIRENNGALVTSTALNLHEMLQDLFALRAASASATLLLLTTADKGLVNVRNDTTAGNRCLDQQVELFVSTDGQLQMARIDTLHFQVFASVAGQLEHFGCQILKNSCRVDLDKRNTKIESIFIDRY